MLLQALLLPNDSICTEYDLYFHVDGIGAFSNADRSIHLKESSWLRFDTFFNSFSVSKWDSDCALESLFLEIEAEGKIEVRVIHAIKNRSRDILYSNISDFRRGEQHIIDLSHYKDSAGVGVIFLELRAWSEEARFVSGFYTTNTAERKNVSLAISITTFKREKEVQSTAKRLEKFLSEVDFGNRVHVFVVDNGNSADVADTDHVTAVVNHNYGGAGGFTRGLIEARDRGFTHCLFMDDDATFHMESVRRTYAYLSLAVDDHTAISGAMIANSRKWAMWEYGAYFEGACRPEFIGADLRKSEVVREMEFATSCEPHPNAYGAWWFFAFPIKHARHLAFPFFVRGDDINFSLVNNFSIKRLNGIVSFQDDFLEKDSPQTLYLDIRNHLVQYLVVDRLKSSPTRMSAMVAFFMLRHLARFHYASAEAQLLAFEDVLKGPMFFKENLDMVEKRAEIKKFSDGESWQPLQNVKILRLPTPTGQRFRLVKKMLAFTLNGQFLPFPIKSKEIRIPIGSRNKFDLVWGASVIHVTDAMEKNFYTVRKSRKRAISLLIRFLKLSRILRRDIKSIRQSYEGEFEFITSQEFWREALELEVPVKEHA